MHALTKLALLVLLPYLWAQTTFQKHGPVSLGAFYERFTCRAFSDVSCSLIIESQQALMAKSVSAFWYDASEKVCRLGFVNEYYSAPEMTEYDVWTTYPMKGFPGYFAAVTISTNQGGYNSMRTVTAVSSSGDVCNETVAIPKTPQDYKSQFSVVYQGYMIFVMGGARASYKSRKKRVNALDLRPPRDQWAWKSRAGMPQERTYPTTAVFGPYIYLFGGVTGTSAGGTRTKRIDRYDVNANSWETLPVELGLAAGLRSVKSSYDNLLWIFFNGLIQRFDLETETFVDQFVPGQPEYIAAHGGYLYSYDTGTFDYLLVSFKNQQRLSYLDTSDLASGWTTLPAFFPSSGKYFGTTFGPGKTFIIEDTTKERYWLSFDPPQTAELVGLGPDANWSSKDLVIDWQFNGIHEHFIQQC